MHQLTITELIAQLAEALRVDDDDTMFAVADILAPRIGHPAVLALTRALALEQRPSTHSLQLQAPRSVLFA
ncbi:MAG: hypothetical protein HGA45_40530 [Chloroflexales bacterium]|nr:hypothetical protein [Chloroflexales bacterium]